MSSMSVLVGCQSPNFLYPDMTVDDIKIEDKILIDVEATKSTCVVGRVG